MITTYGMIELYSKDDIEFLRTEFETLKNTIEKFFNSKMENIEICSINMNKNLTNVTTDIRLHIYGKIYYCVINNTNIDFQYYCGLGALTLYEIEDIHSYIHELYDIFITKENIKTQLEYNSVYIKMMANFETYSTAIREYFHMHTITTDEKENERSLKLAYAMLV